MLAGGSRAREGVEGAAGEQRLTLDGRVVLVDEVGLDELDGQARLSDTAAADDYQLVFSQELGIGSARDGGMEGWEESWGDGAEEVRTLDAIVWVCVCVIMRDGAEGPGGQSWRRSWRRRAGRALGAAIQGRQRQRQAGACAGRAGGKRSRSGYGAGSRSNWGRWCWRGGGGSWGLASPGSCQGVWRDGGGRFECSGSKNDEFWGPAPGEG